MPKSLFTLSPSHNFHGQRWVGAKERIRLPFASPLCPCPYRYRTKRANLVTHEGLARPADIPRHRLIAHRDNWSLPVYVGVALSYGRVASLSAALCKMAAQNRARQVLPSTSHPTAFTRLTAFTASITSHRLRRAVVRLWEPECYYRAGVRMMGRDPSRSTFPFAHPVDWL